MNHKQRQFVNEYTKDFNATQACIRAGYSEGSARSTGCRLLTYDYIQEAIRERLEALTLSQDEVLLRFSEMARGELPTHYTKSDDGTITEQYNTKAALDSLAKAYAMFIDKQQIQVEGMRIVDG